MLQTIQVTEQNSNLNRTVLKENLIRSVRFCDDIAKYKFSPNPPHNPGLSQTYLHLWEGISQIQLKQTEVIELVWNAFRRLVWFESEPDTAKVNQMLELLRSRVADSRSEIMGNIMALALADQFGKKQVITVTKNSKKSLIARPLRKSTSQSKSTLTQRSISAAAQKNKVSDELLGELQRAGQLEAANQLQEADSAYQTITTKNPTFAPAWHSWGLLDVGRNNLPLAAEKMARAVVLDQNQSLFHRNLGEVCRRNGQLEQAVISGKRACELVPKDVDALHNLGLAYLDVQDYKNAISFKCTT